MIKNIKNRISGADWKKILEEEGGLDDIEDGDRGGGPGEEVAA